MSSTRANQSTAQFSLRSLLMGFIWLAFLLGICVQHQRTSAKQRETIQRLKAAGVWPATHLGGGAASQPQGFARQGLDGDRVQ